MLDAVRETAPTTPAHLRDWLAAYTGVSVASAPVCRGHTPPLVTLARQFLERPALALWLGPRGGGKSFLSALDTHLASRFDPRHGTRILGGSLAQSEQIYQALREIILDGRGPMGSDAETVRSLLVRRAVYQNGSNVSILAASERSVRGPHVPSLKLDEVDEIEPELRESATGMCMARHGASASILMTSTWHKIGGPMSELIDRGAGGAFPVDRFCTFEVLERCPVERSGPGLELCPACPLVRWCHDTPDGIPKAKRSDGHYAIASLIQKVMAVSRRVFEADYLCLGPRADGTWFKEFDGAANVAAEIGYDPTLRIHLAIDPGVFTGACFFQVTDGPAHRRAVHILAEYLAEDRAAETVARDLRAIAHTKFLDHLDVVTMDPAGSARSPAGPRVVEQYRAGGLPRIHHWPSYHGSLNDGLTEVEALVKSADGTRRLFVHPSCTRLIAAFGSYVRAKRGGQWMDWPEDPQHPHEDMLDALRGGIMSVFHRKPLSVGIA